MTSSILGVGQSALAAAQAGLATTAHNIANANTPGYSRQIVVQGSAGSQDFGYGFVGKGTEVSDVRRVFNDMLADRVRAAETTSNQLKTYFDQISQINNQLGDVTTGLSPALQGFFKSVQDLSADPNSSASRQATLSTAEALAARFQSLDGQLREVSTGVNSQIVSSVEKINVYAQQIAKLNDAIEKASGGVNGKVSNDLLDERDYAVTQLSQEVKTTVVKQGNSYNVFIGSGQPLVVGAKTYNLVPMNSTTDSSKVVVGYSSNGKLVALDEANLNGGNLGGLFDFRSQTLSAAQNSLGRVAIGLAMTFNDQHKLGQDQLGAMGGDFFVTATPLVKGATTNNSATAADVGAAITDLSKLTTDDYRIKMIGGNFIVTRLSDSVQVYPPSGSPPTSVFPGNPDDAIPGVTLTLKSGSFSEGDEFLIRPTANGAGTFAVAIKDVAQVAAASPIRTSADTTNNTGTGSISVGTVNGPPPVNTDLQQPVTIKFTSATTYDVTGTGAGLPVTGATYTPGADISYNGWTVQISGDPATGDTFSIGPNTNGVGDGRNAVELGKLQAASLLGNGTLTYQGAYAQLVSLVGNKTHEVQMTSQAEAKYLEQANNDQQAESGVNLDEEATNLLRYQQAYQAAGKVMQTASQLFQLLLTIGQN